MTGLIASFSVRRSDAFALSLDLEIPPGRTVALLGPNGAGKSTAVAVVAGLLPVDSGRVELGGEVVDAPDSAIFVPPEERNVGVVFQDYLLFPHMTVLENVAFGLRSRGLSKEESRSRATAWLDRLGLGGLERRRPDDLSGGQAQRVALARALVTDPAALLLDEPLSALDVSTRNVLRHSLSEHLLAFAGPRLVITHDPTEAFLLADEIHVVEDGRVTQSGSPEDIRLRPRTRYAADLAGANLITGLAREGRVEAGDAVLQVADEVNGPVLVTIQPTAISIHRQRPDGSPRNAWETTIERVEHLGGRVRLLTGAPVSLTVEVTSAAHAELGLRPGSRIWLSFKATEVAVRQLTGPGEPSEPAGTS